MSRLKIIHVDMDAFFASVEQRDHPELRGQAVIVGGRPENRGVVAAASYEARAYGIHSAMPSHEAVSRCPQAVLVEPDHRRYKAVSKQLRQLFLDVTPLVERLSLDEAFLDVEGREQRDGAGAIRLATGLKQRIRKRLKLTASIGVSYNKFLAKVASDLEKPDGFTVLTRHKANNLLPGLSIDWLWGVGPKTAARLKHQGIETIADVREAPLEQLQAVLGHRAHQVRLFAQGEDWRRVTAERVPKSVGEEHTFAADVSDPSVLKRYLKQAAGVLSQRLTVLKKQGRTVVLKLRYSDRQTITRRTTGDPLQAGSTILQAAFGLLDQIEDERAVRLIGLSVTNLVEADRPVQLVFPFAGGEDDDTNPFARPK